MVPSASQNSSVSWGKSTEEAAVAEEEQGVEEGAPSLAGFG